MRVRSRCRAGSPYDKDIVSLRSGSRRAPSAREAMGRFGLNCPPRWSIRKGHVLLFTSYDAVVTRWGDRGATKPVRAKDRQNPYFGFRLPSPSAFPPLFDCRFHPLRGPQPGVRSPMSGSDVNRRTRKCSNQLLVERREHAGVEGSDSRKIAIGDESVRQHHRRCADKRGVAKTVGWFGPEAVFGHGRDFTEFLDRLLRGYVGRDLGVGTHTNESELGDCAGSPAASRCLGKPLVRPRMLGVVGPRQGDQEIGVKKVALHRIGWI